ncbi:MAG: hypothetical protein EON88_10300, partial [Brevundimonas sp.]
MHTVPVQEVLTEIGIEGQMDTVAVRLDPVVHRQGVFDLQPVVRAHAAGGEQGDAAGVLQPGQDHLARAVDGGVAGHVHPVRSVRTEGDIEGQMAVGGLHIVAVQSDRVDDPRAVKQVGRRITLGVQIAEGLAVQQIDRRARGAEPHQEITGVGEDAAAARAVPQVDGVEGEERPAHVVQHRV